MNEWEALLAEDGLSPIDNDGKNWRQQQRPGRIPKDPEAVDRYLAWAKEVLQCTAFSSPYQRRVWELFSEGKTYSEIVIELKADPPPGGRLEATGRIRQIRTVPSKHSVMMAIRRVRDRAPLPPLANPWRRDSPGKVAARGQALESLVSKVMNRLRRMSADPQELQRLLEEYTVEKNGTIRYSKILFSKHAPLQIPGVAVARDYLHNIDGRPHAGGIDITVDTKDARGKTGRTRFTVPWHAIRQAEVDLGQEAKAS